MSERKGTPKSAVPSAQLIRGHGLEGDAHAGNWHRQVSLLAEERIAEVRSAGLVIDPGAFGENLVMRDVDSAELTVGRRFCVGSEAVLQITQRGKTCHNRCAIFQRMGDCIMPREGCFARVRRSGRIHMSDSVRFKAEFDRVRWAVCTISDRCSDGVQQDASGPAACDLLEATLGAGRVSQTVVPDEQDVIANELKRLCDDEICDVVVTTGGTGLSPRDVTPEATLSVVDRVIPGLAEAMRTAGLCHTQHAMLSRAVCGQRGQTIIVNLSGSPTGVREQLAIVLPILPHAVATANGFPNDCARAKSV